MSTSQLSILVAAILALVAVSGLVIAWILARRIPIGRPTDCCERREPTWACAHGETADSPLVLELMTVPTGKRFLLETIAASVLIDNSGLGQA
jgi:hypothetical protein